MTEILITGIFITGVFITRVFITSMFIIGGVYNRDVMKFIFSKGMLMT